MPSPTLAAAVVVYDPTTHDAVTYLAGDTPPDWAQRLILNPAAWTGGVAPYATPDPPAVQTNKAAVRAATTANITLSGTQTVDGVALVAGDRVLVKNQTTGSQNGLYTVKSGAWARAADANTGPLLVGASVLVEEGSANADKLFGVATPAPITLDTTAVTWTSLGGGSGAPTGAAGGDLAGTYPNPTVPGKAQALVPTATKTAAYAASAGDFVPVDTTSGAVTVTLPTAPADRTRVAVKHTVQGGINAVTLACGGSDKLNTTTGPTSASLPLLNQAIQVQYVAATGVWMVTANDLPLGQLDVRFAAKTTRAADVASLWIPPGYLSAWDAALAGSGSSLVEATVLGDSTTFGQTSTGASTYSENNYSFVGKLRALAIAAGYTDGGIGNVAFQDSASMDPVNAIVPYQKNFSRTDTGCGTTSGSNVVTDTAILATDIGRKVTPAAGFSGPGFIGSVTPGTSFTVVTTQGGSTAFNATGTNTANMTITGDGFAATGFYGPNLQHDPAPANATQTGFTTVIQGKGSTLRLGYVSFTSGAGSFTYSIDGAGAVTVACSGASRTANYVTVTGLSAGTHTVTITVTVAGSIEIWAEWVNANGVVWHKHGVPGQTLLSRIPANGQSAFALGLGVGSNPANGAIALGKAGPRNVKLAILMEGLNDMAGASSQTDAINKAQQIETAVGVFAAYCQNAGIPGIVAVPWLWYFTNALLYAPLFKRALVSTARAYGLAWVDAGAAIDPVATAAGGATFGTNPHLTSAGYDAVANYLWTNVLNPATATR